MVPESRSGRVLFLQQGDLIPPAPKPESPSSVALSPLTFARVRNRPASVVAFGALIPGSEATPGRTPVGGFPMAEIRNPEGTPFLSDPANLVAVVGKSTPPGRTRGTVRNLIKEARATILLGDGVDGLTPSDIDVFRHRTGPLALFLDQEDLARLSGISREKAFEDSLSLAQTWAQELGLLAVVGGDPYLIAMPDRRLYIQPGRLCWRRSRGGDGLMLGTVAALYDIGFSLEEAVRNGVLLSSQAMEGVCGQNGPLEEDLGEMLEELSSAVQLFLRDPVGFMTLKPAAMQLI